MEKRMKIKNKKYSVILCSILLFSINLTACNKPQKEYIEVGLNDNRSYIAANPWLEFFTGLKVKTQKVKTQEVEVFYGNSRFLRFSFDKEYYESVNQKLEIDRSQMVQLTLTRYIYSNFLNASHAHFEKSEDILVTKNTLGYFMSDEFILEDHSMIDTIEIKDLVHNYDKFGILEYIFRIAPVENEALKIFIDDQPVYSNNCIRSYYNASIYYTIDNQNQILFTEIEEKEGSFNV